MSSSSTQKPTLVQRELNKAKSLAKQDAGAVGSLVSEAALSGAYVYPLYGILYFARNPRLFNAVSAAIYKSIVWSLGIVGAMFFFTYLPQVAVLALVSGPLAFIAAVPVVLAESYVITTFVVKTFLMHGATEKLFDAVLVQKGYSDLVEKGRTLKTKNGATVLGGAILKPISSKFSTEGLWRYLFTLPLNFIPGVGTAFFLFYNGAHAGPAAHNRYFSLKSLSKSQIASHTSSRRGAYTSLGAVSLALGMVPVVGTLFGFTNAVGAALYAADLEKRERSGKGAEETQPGEAQDKNVRVELSKDEL